MTNYYKELNLDRTLGIGEINNELTRQERTWHQREVTMPEKARKMLTLIDEARNIFKTDASRREYDKDLDNRDIPKEILDPEEERKLALKKWKEEACSYYNNKQYDLARTAIEKSFLYLDAKGNNDDIYALAADIYREAGDKRLALDYINKAIVDAPDIAAYYTSKALVYEGMSFYDQMKELLYTAIAKAEARDDTSAKAQALGALAFTLYYRDHDEEQAERFALEADRLGDFWGNARRVLTDIEAKKEENRRAEEEERKKEQYERIYQEALKESDRNDPEVLEKAAKKFEAISQYKDSEQKANEMQKRASYIRELRRLEEETRRKSERWKRIIKKVALYSGIVVGAMVLVALLYTKILKPAVENPKHYNAAVSCLKNEHIEEAAIEFGKAGTYKDAKEQSMSLWKKLTKPNVITLGDGFIVGLKSDGTVVSTQLNESWWSISPGYHHTVAEFNVTNWSDIVSISTGYHHTVGLKRDGTVVATGDNSDNQCSVDKWKNIVQVVTGSRCTIGLKADGTVVYVGEKSRRQNVCKKWKDIVQIWYADGEVFGKTVDGSIVGTRSVKEFETIEGIEKISYSDGCGFLVLTRNHNVCFLPSQYNRQENMSSVEKWENIIDIDGGMGNAVGLKNSGTVTWAGSGEDGQNNVASWSDIVFVTTEDGTTVGVKKDGTLIITSNKYRDYIYKYEDALTWSDIMTPDVSTD